MSRSPLDVTKALFDSDGYRHTLIQATPMQIVTLLEGFYWLWDRRSGRCLIDAVPDAKLSNVRPSYQDMSNKRNPLAETRAFMLAQEAVMAAASSSWQTTRQPAPPSRTPAMSNGPSAAKSTTAAQPIVVRPAPAAPASEPGDDAPGPHILHRAALSAPKRSTLVHSRTLSNRLVHPSRATVVFMLTILSLAVLIQSAN